MIIEGNEVKKIYTHTFAGKAFVYGVLYNGTEVRIPEETIFEMLKDFTFSGEKKRKYVYLNYPCSKLKGNEYD